MRKDMAKVIVERPRYGSSLPSRKKGYRKLVERTAVEELPRRESIFGRWKGLERWLNEHLAPMRRFLRSRVGRPWNKVHQELCEYVSFENAVQKHLLTHVFDYVERHVDLRDGQIVGRRQWGQWRPLDTGHMYVCPVTGILKVVRPAKRQSVPQRIPDGPNCQYHFREGTWFEVGLRKIPDDAGELWDLWLEREVASLTKDDCITAYGGEVFATSQRPLSRTEARQMLARHRRS